MFAVTVLLTGCNPLTLGRPGAPLAAPGLPEDRYLSTMYGVESKPPFFANDAERPGSLKSAQERLSQGRDLREMAGAYVRLARHDPVGERVRLQVTPSPDRLASSPSRPRPP